MDSGGKSVMGRVLDDWVEWQAGELAHLRGAFAGRRENRADGSME
ncbi:hypothetical protein [Burkholderia plantarii]|nr:hypothetical protein [Burkholderia plantarii]